MHAFATRQAKSDKYQNHIKHVNINQNQWNHIPNQTNTITRTEQQSKYIKIKQNKHYK